MIYYFLTVAYDIPDLQMGRGLLHGPYKRRTRRAEAIDKFCEETDLETGCIVNITKLDCDGPIVKDESYLAEANDEDEDAGIGESW